MKMNKSRDRRGLRPLGRYLLSAAVVALTFGLSQADAASLTQVSSFGSNPGNLTMYKYVPSGLPSGAPLVVALHGCTQSAQAYADGSGWIKYADRDKFAVIFPEQNSGNNQNKCFNWFESGDITRGQGEPLSIKNMVEKMKADHGVDPNKVFVTGLSAGGFMTDVMLATYPDVFAGGAPVAGGPYKCATSMTAAFSCMSPGVNKSASAWGDLARSGYSGWSGRKPIVSIWHGDADYTVKVMNQTEQMEQWTNYAGADQSADVSDTVKGYPHKVYKNSAGTAVVETYTISGMGHGTPVDPSSNADQCGSAGAYILDVNICSSYYIGKFWGIVDAGTDGGTGGDTGGGTGGDTGGSTLYCGSATNDAHVTAGRATGTGMYAYYTVGARDYMGWNGSATTTLQETSAGQFELVSECPTSGGGTGGDSGGDTGGGTGGDSGFACTESYASNYSHVRAGRAQVCNSWYACAVGSGTNLGLNNTYTYNTLAETSAGHYEKGSCP